MLNMNLPTGLELAIQLQSCQIYSYIVMTNESFPVIFFSKQRLNCVAVIDKT